MITRQTDYAIRALLRLAQLKEGQVLSTTVLAAEMEIPYRFLRRILLDLGEHGLVTSTRGKQGGLCLARAPETITLLAVIRAVDPEAITLNLCLADEAACHRMPRCVVHEELAGIQAQLNRSLAAVTLRALAERERRRTG